MYLGLHTGQVFFGNIGSKDRLDFTIVGPAVNETSRIATMCRSVDQPLLVSHRFADCLGDAGPGLVSVGRFALRGVGARRTSTRSIRHGPDWHAACCSGENTFGGSDERFGRPQQGAGWRGDRAGADPEPRRGHARGSGAQTDRICALVGKARRNMATMDLVVFPEYALHGLSMDTNPAIMCRLDGPEVEKFRHACVANDIWGCFSIMELNPYGNPFNSGLIIDNKGEIKLYYRKMHPWVPVEPWEPGDLGIPVCDGPNGSRIALIICHDGMFPEMAREAAYKGGNVMLRTAGYTAPIRQSWHFTNQSNAFCNLMYTASVCLAGSDGSFNSMGEGMIVNYDGTPLVTGTGIPDEIITGEVRPDLCDEARTHWGVENNIYQFGHRGYVAVKGGARDCPYTYMHDLAAGKYALPWEKSVKVTDGTSCGFAPPTRDFRPVPSTLPAKGTKQAAE